MISIITRIQGWFERAKPSPTEKDFQVQLGVHFEEMTEMLECLDAPDFEMKMALSSTKASMYHLSGLLKSGRLGPVLVMDSLDFLDSIADQIVTATGVGQFHGCSVDAALEEVNRSNFSKFNDDGTPIFNEQGKIMKGPNYSPPDLTPYLNR